MGDIRKLHKLFRNQRRSYLDFEDPDAVITDDYFKTCAQYIPLLETIRKANLNKIYLKASKTLKLSGKTVMPLEEIAKKIDYEKVCNLGLYSRDSEFTEDLLEMDTDKLKDIQEHCNDTVMKQYRMNKGRTWAQNVS